jgi:hypothetical protein
VATDASGGSYDDRDVFGHEEGHDIQYKTLGWKVRLSAGDMDSEC